MPPHRLSLTATVEEAAVHSGSSEYLESESLLFAERTGLPSGEPALLQVA